MIVACGALYPQGGQQAELACMATHPDYRDEGRGQKILEQIEKNARKVGVNMLFVLTTKTPHWFVERGFVASNVDELPERKKSLYNYQRNSMIFTKPL
jgi:amino-acid N-acetyltransferase